MKPMTTTWAIALRSLLAGAWRIALLKLTLSASPNRPLRSVSQAHRKAAFESALAITQPARI
jgi:hypothetical protein